MWSHCACSGAEQDTVTVILCAVVSSVLVDSNSNIQSPHQIHSTCFALDSLIQINGNESAVTAKHQPGAEQYMQGW
jgi:hypothetical protein